MFSEPVQTPTWPFRSVLFVLAAVYGGILGAATGCAIAVPVIGFSSGVSIGGLFGLLYGVPMALFSTLASGLTSAWLNGRYSLTLPKLVIAFATTSTAVCALILPVIVPPTDLSGTVTYLVILVATWTVSWLMGNQARR